MSSGAGVESVRASFVSARSEFTSTELGRSSFDRPNSRASSSYTSARPLSAFQPLDGSNHARPQSQLFHAPPRLSMSVSGSNMQITFKSIDLRNALQLHEAQSRKLYMEGYLLMRHALGVDGQPDHRSDHFNTWTECFVQLSGTVLSFWEASALDRATAEGREVAPTFMNITDAMVDYIGMYVDAPFSDPGKRCTLYHVFAINSAGSNRVLFCFPLPPPCDPTKVHQRLSPKNEQHPEHKPVSEWYQLGNRYLQSWINAVRLASWERLRLDEIYTGALIRARLSAVKGYESTDVSHIMVRSPLSKGRFETWVRARFMGSTEWRHCWMVLQSHWSDEANPSGLRRFLRFGGAGDRTSRLLSQSDANSHMEPPTPPPGVLASPAVAHFYESKRSRQPFASLWHVRHVYALYPSRPDLVEDSILFKAEGSLPQSQIVSATHRPRTSGWVMFMPDTSGPHGKVANAEMMKCIIAFMDAFRLYGRPEHFVWDPRNPVSPFFAYPIGPYKNHLFLDRALTEYLDISVEDHLQSRQMLHDVMAARMRGEDTAMLPPLPPIPRHSSGADMEAQDQPEAPSDVLSHEAQAPHMESGWAVSQDTGPVSMTTTESLLPANAPQEVHEAWPASSKDAVPADASIAGVSTIVPSVSEEPARPATIPFSSQANAPPAAPSTDEADALTPTSSSTKRQTLKAGAFQSLMRSLPAKDTPATLSSDSNAAFDQAYREYDVHDPTPISLSDDDAYFTQKSAAIHALENDHNSPAVASGPSETTPAPPSSRSLPSVRPEKKGDVVYQVINHRHDEIYQWPIPPQNDVPELSPIQEASSAGGEAAPPSLDASNARPLPQHLPRHSEVTSPTISSSHTFASERPPIQVKVIPKPTPRSSSGSRPLPIPGQAGPAAPPGTVASWPEVQPKPVVTKAAAPRPLPTVSTSQVSPASQGSTPSPAIPSSLSFLAPSVPTTSTAPAPAPAPTSSVPSIPPGSRADQDAAPSRHVSGTDSDLVQQYLDEDLGSSSVPISSATPASSTVTALRSVPDTSKPQSPVPSDEPQEDETWLYGAPDLEPSSLPLELQNPTIAEQEAVQAVQAASQEPLAYPSSFGRKNKQAHRDSSPLLYGASRPGRAPGAASVASHDWVDYDEEEGLKASIPASPSLAPTSLPGAVSRRGSSPPETDARLSSYGNLSATSTPTASAMGFRSKNASSTSLGRTTFVKFEEPAQSQNPYLPHGLLATSPQDKVERSARTREPGVRESGQTLVSMPQKPPPPQAGLMGAIHSRERRTVQGERELPPSRPVSMSASRSSQSSAVPGMTRSISQQQMMMNMYYWQQQQMMMMMGMMPPGMPGMTRESFLAQQQAMQAAQQAYFQAYAQHTGMPMMPYPPMPDMSGGPAREPSAWPNQRTSESGGSQSRVDSPPHMYGSRPPM